MRVLTHKFYDVGPGDLFTIVPIGDIHIGAAACDEDRLRRVVERVRADPNCYWVGLGDYCDFINISDPRFSPTTLAPWVTVGDLGDLARAQAERVIEFLSPIADRCLGLVQGNHSLSIQRHYERSIYSDIVTSIKEAGGFAPSDKLALGYNGWILLKFYRYRDTSKGSRQITINVHHGFVGGRLAGAKALNMQRWLWNHDCDIAIFGHSHNTGFQVEAVETVTRGGKVEHKKRYGVYGGSFLRSFNEDGPSTYSEVKGYFPQPLAGVELLLDPYSSDRQIRIVGN